MIQITRFSAKLWILGRYPEIENWVPQTSPFRSLYTREHGGKIFSCFRSRNRVSLTIYHSPLAGWPPYWPQTRYGPRCGQSPPDWPILNPRSKLHTFAPPCAAVRYSSSKKLDFRIRFDTVPINFCLLVIFPVSDRCWNRWCLTASNTDDFRS